MHLNLRAAASYCAKPKLAITIMIRTTQQGKYREAWKRSTIQLIRRLMPEDRFNPIHKVRDPIHGFIRFNELEKDIINTLPFQRLRRIKQLGPTSLVYPGAEHTRFQHSLGVMHVATRVFDLLLPEMQDRLGWTKEDADRNKQLLRISALLHDLGHGPFSHVSEKLFPNGKDHEDYSIEFVNTDPIKSFIDADCQARHGFGADAVADLIVGRLIDPRAAFLNEILSGDLDADKMDYLLRDSLFCGVAYGIYDIERLLHTLTLREIQRGGNWVLAVEEDGINVAEELVLARYFMFIQVYFHGVRRIYDHHLEDFLQAAMGGTYPLDLKAFAEWDDVRVTALLLDKAKAGDNLAKRILERDHFREVASTSDHMDSAEEVLWSTMMDEFVRASPGITHYVDESTKAPHGFQETELHVVLSPVEAIPIIKRSDLVASLKPILKRRLYVDESRADAVKALCDAHVARHRPGKGSQP